MLTSDEQTFPAYTETGQIRAGYIALSKGIVDKLLKCCNACLDKKGAN